MFGLDWQARAACRDVDPELFFPASQDYTASPNVRALIAAGEVCGRCPVRRECLTYAVDSGQTFGIWAGRSPVELRAIRRARMGGDPDPDVDRDPMCPGCSLLFALPVVDGTACWLCQERGVT
ncbi:WhiB family transcriptional regulator [Actinomycetospora lutea]|uniref:WhiB family transcriptional regulator n=1 Tax=Actinomycetospora lutea TaxID=663604 RepID=UPI003082234F